MTYLFASLYADSLYAIGQKDDAIVWSKRALVLAPDCVDCRRDLAIQLKETGRKKEAMELLMTYDNEMKDQGKQQSFQGLIMIIQDELKSLN